MAAVGRRTQRICWLAAVNHVAIAPGWRPPAMSDFVRAPSAAMIALSSARDASDDDEEETRPRAGVGGPSSSPAPPEPSSAGGSSSSRKPRGRPPGSKNKPKPPIVITKASESAMHPVVLELAAGSEVVSGVSDFARRRGVGVSVLGGSGSVADVTLRHPSGHGPGSISVPGRFEILSLSGTLLPPPGPSAPAWPARPPPLTVSLAGPHGQVIGGTVAGPMTAAGPVLLVAATFSKPEFLRLPLAEDDEEAPKEVEAKPGAEGTAPSRAEQGALAGPLVHPDMVLWAQPASARPPHSHPPPHY